ncbi:MAG: 6-phosphogluconolactonase [Gammaproteobacteria bacterium]|nr:6-phosphogluconolactonase [Gammaproteobacteria bacterium]
MQETTQTCRWHVYPTPQALKDAALLLITHSAQTAIAARGAFHIVLAGGNTPRAIYAGLSTMDTAWQAWHIYYGDERCLPPDDPARNSVMVNTAWLHNVAIPSAQIHSIPAERGAATAAEAYAAVLQRVGVFDLVVLGLGEDGHTASLFPGHVWGSAENSPPALPINDAPLPYTERVSLSAHRLSLARQVVFVVSGTSKQHAVALWQSHANIPAATITPANGVDILADQSAMTPTTPTAQ